MKGATAMMRLSEALLADSTYMATVTVILNHLEAFIEELESVKRDAPFVEDLLEEARFLEKTLARDDDDMFNSLRSFQRDLQTLLEADNLRNHPDLLVIGSRLAAALITKTRIPSRT